MKTIPMPSFLSTEPSYPVIRIDYKGRILFANRASFPILREWNCLANDYLPEDLIHQFPSVLDLNADFDLQISTNDTSYFMDVIGFKESGYVGLYGFRTEINAPTFKQKNILASQY